MNDWMEWLAVLGIASSLVVVVYGLVMLQSQVFTDLLTKYALLAAKLAQFGSICFYCFKQQMTASCLVLSRVQHLSAIVGFCQRLSKCA